MNSEFHFWKMTGDESPKTWTLDCKCTPESTCGEQLKAGSDAVITQFAMASARELHRRTER